MKQNNPNILDEDSLSKFKYKHSIPPFNETIDLSYRQESFNKTKDI